MNTDIEAETEALVKHVANLRGKLPPAAMPDPAQWLTIEQAAGLLGTTTAAATTMLAKSGLTKDQRGRDCIARRGFDSFVTKLAAGRPTSVYL